MAGTKKETGSVFEQLRDDLFQEAAELVSEVPSTRIAIFVTPPPGYESDIAACSYGHPSVEAVSKNFLDAEAKGMSKAAAEDEEEAMDFWSPRGWWNDATLFDSMSLDHLLAVRDQLTTLKNRVMLLEMEAKSTPEGSSENPDDQPKP